MLFHNPQTVAAVVLDVARNSKGLNPFGERYPLDRRYKINAIAGHGNGTIDTTYGHVGYIQFKLYVDRSIGHVECTPLKREDYFNI